jgi:ankyrin repeat protein
MDMLDVNGETALHIACRENLLTVVQTMCALGCRVDIKNKKEMTPLHSAFFFHLSFIFLTIWILNELLI